jgi:hypothetical protein
MVLDFLTLDWGGLCDRDEWVPFYPLSHTFISHISHPSEKPRLSSKQAKIMMDSLIPIIFFNKSIRPSISLKALPRAGPKSSSYSTMHPAIKSMHRMPYQHDTWWKVSHQHCCHCMFSLHMWIPKPTNVECGCPLFATWSYHAGFVLTSLTGPKEGWMHHSNGPPMHSSTLPNGKPQTFYFPEDHPSMPGWFKGIEIIIRECGLWPKGDLDILAQCPGFHCPPGHMNCCC